MWTEYLNRLLGVTVGFLILATVVSAWRHHRREPPIFWSTVGALLLTGFEGWLGGRVVANDLAPWIVTAHLIVALVIVQLLLYATVRAWRKAGRRASALLIGLILLTMFQIGLGTQVRGGVDTALDNGVPRDAALSSIVGLTNAHRDAAIVVVAVCFATVLYLTARFPKERTIMKWAYTVAALAGLQILFGMTLSYVALKPVLQIGHLTIASLLLGAETVLLLVTKQGTA
jgi:cytochrome c oxidase assembly protein subunit 15